MPARSKQEAEALITPPSWAEGCPNPQPSSEAWSSRTGTTEAGQLGQAHVFLWVPGLADSASPARTGLSCAPASFLSTGISKAWCPDTATAQLLGSCHRRWAAVLQGGPGQHLLPHQACPERGTCGHAPGPPPPHPAATAAQTRPCARPAPTACPACRGSGTAAPAGPACRPCAVSRDGLGPARVGHGGVSHGSDMARSCPLHPGRMLCLKPAAGERHEPGCGRTSVSSLEGAGLEVWRTAAEPVQRTARAIR